MGHAAARTARFTKEQRRGFGLALLLSLIFLLSGSIPSLISLPGLLARFTGVETTALASSDQSCDDGGHYFTYTFTDRHGKIHHMTNTFVCSSGIIAEGEYVTIWYQPDDPSQLITANDLNFDMIFLVFFSIPFFLFLGYSVFFLFRRFTSAHPSQEKAREEHAQGPQI